MEEVNNKDKLILVYYLDVRNINTWDIGEYMQNVMKKITLKSPIIGEIIAIPTNGESRVECINPKYITEPELIREHRLKIDELQDIMNNYIEENKNNYGKKRMDKRRT